MKDGIKDSDKTFIINKIKTFFPSAKIIVFGSRLTPKFRNYSDLDICLDDNRPLDLVKLSYLEEALTQSDILYKVDIVDWNRVTKEFQKIILERHEEW